MSLKQLLHTIFQTNTPQGLKRALAIYGFQVDLRRPASLETVIDFLFEDGSSLTTTLNHNRGVAQDMDDIMFSILDDEMLEAYENLLSV